ncbi:MAG: histidine--tRNA ligase [Phycisphaerales bacterium]
MNRPIWFQAPIGTRDLEPRAFARRRYIEEAWRRVSVSHGFEEIDGPTFEHLDLYTHNSGQTLSAKALAFSQRGGEMVFALRPEFTPTLARMYAGQAEKPAGTTRWFFTGSCFRAERTASGRPREFRQWNADVIGDGSAQADAEIIACCAALLDRVGLTPRDVRIRLSHRVCAGALLAGAGVSGERMGEAFDLLDLRSQVSPPQAARQAAELGLALAAFDAVAVQAGANFAARRFDDLLADVPPGVLGAVGGITSGSLYQIRELATELDRFGVLEWCDLELSVVRGLSYYTGMVFEVAALGAAGAARSLGGGGRYDDLITRFGGSPTSAVGFGMSDIPLAVLLAERGLMPTDEALRSMLGSQCDVLLAGPHDLAAEATRLLAACRAAGLHARPAQSVSTATGEARAIGARFCATLTGDGSAHFLDLGTGEAKAIPAAELLPTIATLRARPSASASRSVARTTN